MPMKKIYSLLAAFITAHILIIQPTNAQVKPIALHPQNPHYFLYHNKATVLITSGEHYGAVMNTDFDYITYLNTLASKGLNLTRTFTASYPKLPSPFNITPNPSAP